MQTTATPPRRALEFGIYRDGDNNLDAMQESTITQAIGISRRSPGIAFTVEDTTSQRFSPRDQAGLSTDDFTIADGRVSQKHESAPHEMSDPKNLAAFVARTLDDAEASGAKQTWLDLVDHGGGDGGGLETSDGKVMSMPAIAGAIAQGIAMHAREHPEDAGRHVDGVVANQCLMATLGFATELSNAGVKYLAASPETMIAPGVPTSVAEAISNNENDSNAMARAVVRDVMHTAYDAGPLGTFGPAAAFDVLDLDAHKIGAAEDAIKRLNDALAAAASDRSARANIRSDIRSVDGMARIPESTPDMPWHADRPAIAVYNKLASDRRLDSQIRTDANAASGAVSKLVLAHAESRGFEPFGGADYSDAAGPTAHLPASHAQVDPWAPFGISETDNAFYRGTDGGALARAVA